MLCCRKSTTISMEPAGIKFYPVAAFRGSESETLLLHWECSTASREVVQKWLHNAATLIGPQTPAHHPLGDL